MSIYYRPEEKRERESRTNRVKGKYRRLLKAAIRVRIDISR